MKKTNKTKKYDGHLTLQETTGSVFTFITIYNYNLSLFTFLSILQIIYSL